MEMRKFYQTATEYLFSKLPLAKKLLKDLALLYPLLQKAERGLQAIVRIVKKMSQVISQEEISLLTDEWTLCQAQVIPESWY